MSKLTLEEKEMMEDILSATDKVTLPMDVSKGLHFDFTIEGITEEQASKILDSIIEQVKEIVPDWGNVFAGGYISVAHEEELESIDLLDDLLDLVDDDTSLEDLENWEGGYTDSADDDFWSFGSPD